MTRAGWFATALVGLVTLAGCTTGDAASQQTPTTTGTTTMSPSTTPTTPSTSSATTPAADTGIPAAARAQTAKGAEAFVRYYFDQFNHSWTTPDASLLGRLSLRSCKTCTNVSETAQEYEDKRRRVDRPPFILRSVDATSVTGNPIKVVVQGQEQATRLISSDGSLVRQNKGGPAAFMVACRWTSLGWRVQEIQVIRS